MTAGRAALLAFACACGAGACGDDDGAAPPIQDDARLDEADAAPALGPCSAEVVLLGSGLDVQVPVLFDSSQAVASGSIQPDCDDLRVQTESGADLPFWLESGCGTAATRLWFRSAALSPGSVYLSWGYRTRPRASNVEATFLGVVGEEGALAAAWPMEEEEPERAADATGAGHDGALLGGPTRALDGYGHSLVLDGVDDAMLVGDSAAFDSPSFSFEARLWPDGTGESAIASRNDFPNATGWVLWLGHAASPQGVTFQHAGATETVTLVGTRANPSHVALTYEGATLRLYVDGGLEAMTDLSSVAESFDDELRVGTTNGPAADGTPFFRGRVDDVRFWTRALAPGDVAELSAHRGSYVTPALPGRVLLLEPGQDVSATVLRARCQGPEAP